MESTPSKKSNTTSRKTREAFYKQAQRLTGFTDKRCREILVDTFGANFEADKIPQYLALLKQHAEDARTQAAMAERREKLRNKLREVPVPESCPVCTGVMQPSRIYPWVCSVGGMRCYLAVVTAKHTGRTAAVEAVIQGEAVERRKNELIAQYQQWKEEMKQPYEATEWHQAKEA